MFLITLVTALFAQASASYEQQAANSSLIEEVEFHKSYQNGIASSVYPTAFPTTPPTLVGAASFNRIGDVCLGDEIGGAEAKLSLRSRNAGEMFNECKSYCESNGACIAFNVAYDDEVGEAQRAVCYEYTTIVGTVLFGDLYINKRHLKDNHFGVSEHILGCYIQVNQCK
eukprot:jgi/Bigna1/91476/estExt_fgenesh1_pg.C_1020033